MLISGIFCVKYFASNGIFQVVVIRAGIFT